MLGPVFEADFLSCSFGFQPKRSATDALKKIRALTLGSSRRSNGLPRPATGFPRSPLLRCSRG